MWKDFEYSSTFKSLFWTSYLNSSDPAKNGRATPIMGFNIRVHVMTVLDCAAVHQGTQESWKYHKGHEIHQQT